MLSRSVSSCSTAARTTRRGRENLATVFTDAPHDAREAFILCFACDQSEFVVPSQKTWSKRRRSEKISLSVSI